MYRNEIKKTIRNTIIEYNTPSISDKRSAISWLYNVLKSQIIKVCAINLSDISRSVDEGNTSTSISEVKSKNELFDMVKEYNTDIVSINADYDGKPIIIGVNLGNLKPFIVFRNSKKPNMNTLEKLFNLK